ncbi:MAG: sensor domain-containing diguanylate cyclase [Pseudomonadota bacterium]|nr:sensor domain-containing diguanylate cyclase [Pseudomonadota bacterium]
MLNRSKKRLKEQEEERLAALARYNILDTLPEPAYDDVVEIAACIATTPVALITLLDRDRQWFKAKLGLAVDSTPREHSLCNHLLQLPLGEVLIIPDTHADPRFAVSPLVLSDPNIRFYMGAPLITRDEYVLGALCVIDHVVRHPTAQQVQALRALARQVMQLLELRYRNHEIRELLSERAVQMRELSNYQVLLEQHNRQLLTESRTDRLTKIGNRAALDQYLVESYESCLHVHQPLSVMLIDVDHFKAYNDQFGHPAGDLVLQQVAALLYDSCRTTDFAARYGGEEFMLILPETTARTAMQVAERLRRRIAEENFPNRQITVSIGVARMIPRQHEAPVSMQDLVGRADHALYQAKGNGRNQVVLFDDRQQVRAASPAI